MKEHHYYVYIATNNPRTLYTGVTNDLLRRMQEHREGKNPGFTQKYRIKKLVYFEETQYIDLAIAREKEIKAWRREKKVKLIEGMNPEWRDLYDGLVG